MFLAVRALVFVILGFSVLVLVLPGWGGLSEAEGHDNAGTELHTHGHFEKAIADYDV